MTASETVVAMGFIRGAASSARGSGAVADRSERVLRPAGVSGGSEELAGVDEAAVGLRPVPRSGRSSLLHISMDN